MLITERLIISEAQECDIKLVMELERQKDSRDFVWQGTYEEHKYEIQHNDFYLFIIKEQESNLNIGFALCYIDNKSDKFELRRIVVSKKGMGYGKEVMIALIKFAFEKLGMNRFWLDVYSDNIVGIKLYECIGMKREGILRQNFKSHRGYLDQIIYSILKSEYDKK